MVRRSGFVLIFAMLSMLLGTTTISAQTPEPSHLPEFAELEGIQSAVVRTWGIDYPAILAATPDYQPDILGEPLTILGGYVLAFDSGDNARSAYDAFAANIAAELGTMSASESDTITEEPIDDLGDAATVATLVTDTDEYSAAVRYVLALEGSTFFLTMAIANSNDNAQPANELAAWLVNEGEPGDDQILFDPTGLSSGGPWDYFPASDNPLLTGLVPISDEVLYAESVGDRSAPDRA